MKTELLAVGFMFSAGTCFIISIIIALNELFNQSKSNMGLLFIILLFGWVFYLVSVALKNSIK